VLRHWLGMLAVVLVWAACARGQYEAPAESMLMQARAAYTWGDEKTSIIMLEGPVSIELDKNKITAQNAVVWISQVPRTLIDLQRVEIALIGEAKLVQPNDITRSGGKLYIDARLRGPVRLLSDKRTGGDHSDSDLYKTAAAMRPQMIRGGEAMGRWVIEEEQPAGPTSQPAQRNKPLEPLHASFDNLHSVLTPQGKVAIILSGNVSLVQRARNGDLLELQADRVVVFTPYNDLREIQGGEMKAIEEAVTGAYLEGDVRIVRTPKSTKETEQRLTANRAYYDFTTDRAVLTEVVMQTMDAKSQIPITLRASIVRQLSQQEYTAEKSVMSTSQFATPSYSLGAQKTYIRQLDEGDEVLGTRTIFTAKDATFRLGDMPLFYTPYAAGSITERNLLRRAETSNSSKFGFGVDTEWGLFESLGKVPPKGVDASYKLDYFSDRGPATGLFGKYVGGSVSETTLEPWSYSGDFKSYLLEDHGKDDLGRERVDVEPEHETRGYFYWRHQHFLPDDWQVQLTGGYISDPTFLEQWFNREFRTQGPHDTSLYLKHQKDSEAYTFLASVQPNHFVTTSDLYQEQLEVERLPEFSYQRIGDSLLSDNATWFSANSASALKFQKSHATLEELGFARATHGFTSPGIPSLGTPYQTNWTAPSDTTYRGDTRQEVDFPFSMGQFRVVPYVMGRYTAYSQSVDGAEVERLYAGAGVRMTTAWWKVDDSYNSSLFDLHRLRHVVEPELNLYAATESKSKDELFIYDEQIDAINDIGAMSLAVNQRWQTKRGGPGQWRSVDFFTLNTELNLFFNKPPDRELDPTDFRGLFFVSRPETSVPRDSLNMDWNWTLSDSVSVMGDVQYNLSESLLATASIGMRVRMDPRFNYFVGLRHIGVNISENDRFIINGNTFIFENQDLGIVAVEYQLATNYKVQLATSYDFAQKRDDRSTVTLIRHFDRFYAAISFRRDEFEGDNAVFFNLWPEGLEPGGGSAAAASALGQ
jgi:lipopolysaccharide assembly outer membrane protein LptD (OstA)